MTAPDPAWVEAGAKALADEGGLPGSSIHSWRCEEPDRYGGGPIEFQCDCVAQTVVEIIAAVEPLIREQIAAEIEAQPIDHRSPGRANVSGLVTFARREAYLRAATIARGGAQ